MKVLEKVRREQEMNKADLARATKMQGSTIGQIESGRLIPYASQLRKIADALNWPEDPSLLLNDTEE